MLSRMLEAIKLRPMVTVSTNDRISGKFYVSVMVGHCNLVATMTSISIIMIIKMIMYDENNNYMHLMNVRYIRHTGIILCLQYYRVLNFAHPATCMLGP